MVGYLLSNPLKSIEGVDEKHIELVLKVVYKVLKSCCGFSATDLEATFKIGFAAQCSKLLNMVVDALDNAVNDVNDQDKHDKLLSVFRSCSSRAYQNVIIDMIAPSMSEVRALTSKTDFFQVVKSSIFKHLEVCHLKLLLKEDHLNISEEELLEAVVGMDSADIFCELRQVEMDKSNI